MYLSKYNSGIYFQSYTSYPFILLDWLQNSALPSFNWNECSSVLDQTND